MGVARRYGDLRHDACATRKTDRITKRMRLSTSKGKNVRSRRESKSKVDLVWLRGTLFSWVLERFACGEQALQTEMSRGDMRIQELDANPSWRVADRGSLERRRFCDQKRNNQRKTGVAWYMGSKGQKQASGYYDPSCSSQYSYILANIQWATRVVMPFVSQLTMRLLFPTRQLDYTFPQQW